jgi:anti-sigma B factor antagonist
MSMKVVSRLVGDVLILDFCGRITQGEGAVILRDSVRSALAQGQNKILLNIAEVNYIDSTGVGELTSAFTSTRNQGGELKLAGLTKKVHDLLQISKLYTVFDVKDNESAALEAFSAPPLRCCCPLCGQASGPSVMDIPWVKWPPQSCRNARCEATFDVVSARTRGQAVVKTVRIQTYKNEYFELLSGPPLTVKIVGRLDLFSSPALKKSWQILPLPRRVLFDLSAMTDVDKAGREALLDLLAAREKEARAVVSLEGLSSEQVNGFPSESCFYQNRTTALAALGDLSNAPLLHVRVLSE